MPTLPHNIDYVINQKNGVSNVVNLRLEPDSHEICTDKNYIPPNWARLEYHRCTNCTLDANVNPFCPIAKNIAFSFKNIAFGASFEKVELVVHTESRSYVVETTLQRALGSLFGLISSLSNCPHTLPLRPMGLFHLPLSTESETLARASSFFLLKQYLDHINDSSVKVDLTKMVEAYKNLKELNSCFIKRFREIDSSDATINALILLDLLAKDVDFELDDYLNRLRGFFASGNDNYVVANQ